MSVPVWSKYDDDEWSRYYGAVESAVAEVETRVNQWPEVQSAMAAAASSPIVGLLCPPQGHLIITVTLVTDHNSRIYVDWSGLGSPLGRTVSPHFGLAAKMPESEWLASGREPQRPSLPARWERWLLDCPGCQYGGTWTQASLLESYAYALKRKWRTVRLKV